MKGLKKLTVVMIACAFVGSYSNAQMQMNEEDDELRIRLGAKVGMNHSNVYDSEGEDFAADGKIGFAAGAFVSIPIGRYLGFQPEVMFSQRGFSGNGAVFGMPYGMKRTSNYLDVPLLFSFRPAPFISILVGPQYSYLLSQRDDFESSAFDFMVEEEFDNDNIRKNTLCFVGGIDVNVGHFVIGARAGWDLMDNKGDGTSSTPRYKNVWGQATFGVRI